MYYIEPDKQSLIQNVVEDIKLIPDVAAIALGGSYAQGNQRADSDVDLGLYYVESAPFSIEAIRHLAYRIDDRPNPIVTDFYEWGPWVNGGAWLAIGGLHIDFLYRNIDQLQRIVDESQAGYSAWSYEQQPPYGFYSHIYLGELQTCKPLYDPQGVLSKLKAQIVAYPKALKNNLINGYLWGADFTLLAAEKSARRGDVYTTAGCLTRAASNLTQVLFALNEVYFVTDKGALDLIDTFSLKPESYSAVTAEILSKLGSDPAQLVAKVKKFKQLFQQVAALCQEWYKPPYPL